MESLNNIIKIIKEIESTNSSRAKEHILRKNQDSELFKKVLLYTYDPNKKYGVSESYLEKLPYDPNDDNTSYNNLWLLLDTLAKSNINDHLRNELRMHINYYQNENIRNLIKRIVGKNLKCNINIKMINKVFKDLIPTSDGEKKIECQLGSKVDLDKIPQDKIKFVTEKYDGCRCWAFIENGKVELYSRQGKRYENCKEIEEDLLKLGIDNVLLDGEILATDCNYDNVYKETTKRLKNKKPIKIGLYLMLFDYIEMDEYKELKGKYKYSERRKKLDLIQEQQFVKVAPVLATTKDMNKILNILDEYRNKGAEGLMIDLDDVYYFKRTKSLIKLKVMATIDLRVIGFEEGTNKNKGKLGAVLVKYKDNIVKVGSGWNDHMREEVWKNQTKYLGKILEISYFEETKNKDGSYSLRFPIAKRWRLDKDEESYN